MHKALHSIVASLRSKFDAAKDWSVSGPVDTEGQSLGSQLEVIFVLILFFIQVGLPMTGIQVNFWGALVCWLVIVCLLVRFVWKWETTVKFRNISKLISSIVIAGIVFSLVYPSLRNTFLVTVRPSFIYLMPGDLLANCDKRAFVVKHNGVRVLANPEIVLWDNKSNQGTVERYAEVVSGDPYPDSPKYFWWSPSIPWDEDYTFTITSGELRIHQRLVLRSTRGTLQRASEVKINGKLVFSCRDSGLPAYIRLSSDAKETCDELEIPKDVVAKLEPTPWSNQSADEQLVVSKLKELIAPDGVNGQAETRHIWEYQNEWLREDLEQFHGTKVLLVASDSGDDTWNYAQDIRKALLNAKWDVKGPERLPPVYNGLLEIQISTDNTFEPRPRATALLNSLKRAGIKHRSQIVLDPAVASDSIVVWVGSRAPDSVNADDCANVSLNAGGTRPHPCMYVSQTTKQCRIIPP